VAYSRLYAPQTVLARALFVIVYRVLRDKFGVFPSAQKVVNGVCNRKFKRVFVLARFMATAFPLAMANIIIVLCSRVARTAARRHTVAAVAAKGFSREYIRLNRRICAR